MAIKAYRTVNGTAYDTRTAPSVITELEMARTHGDRLRIFYGDPVTGRDWLEEHGVTGTIGRSTGQLQIPLIIHSNRSHGGSEILTENILRIMRDGKDIYRHPNYVKPTFEIKPHDDEFFRQGVYVNGYLHAGFETKRQAQRWIDYMSGKRATR
jgi:hypothetical protein